VLQKINEGAAAGVDWIQIREKDLGARDLAALTHSSLLKAFALGAFRPTILVNDRLDVALTEEAGGVHLGEQSIPVEKAVQLADQLHVHSKAPLLIGASCHSLATARTAAASGADYLFFGPIFATPSKTAYGSPQGLDRLMELCAAVSIPIIAIGGINQHNAAACLAARAAGIAAIRLFQDASDLPGLVQTLHALPLR
jgi:thiamine-phosphate pyrophosphorylase